MIHRHLLVRGRGRAKLGPDEATELLRSVIDLVGMRIAAVPGNPLVYDCHVRGNEGVTAAAVIETSHCVLHTWVRESHGLTLYQFDLYSCAHFDPQTVCAFLKTRLDLVTFERLVIDRTIGMEVM